MSYLSVAALGLCCRTWAFSSCGEQVCPWSGDSHCRAWALGCSGAVGAVDGLSYPVEQ